MTRTMLVRVAVLAALVAGSVVPGALAAPAGAGGAAPKWTVVKSPSPPGPPIGSLTAVSCATPKSCFAVGAGSSGPITERWNGSAWSTVRSPSFGSSVFAALNALSCSSPTSCIALGYLDSNSAAVSSTLAERWNGRSWTVIASPTAPGNDEIQFGGISCVSAKSCFAVGYRFSDLAGDSSSEPLATGLIAHWNGTSWSTVASPTPKGSFLTILSGVSCVSAKSCFAVGDYFSRTGGGPLIERWNGVRWSIVPSPKQGPANGQLKYRIKPGAVTTIIVSGGLTGVSCSSATRCFAVGGGFSGGALFERWNGAKWKIVPSPALPHGYAGQVNAVSCASAHDCSAVGTEYNGSILEGDFEDFSSSPLAEHWNGTAWSIEAQPPGALFTSLSSVSCPAVNNCAAVGSSAFAQHWDGTQWSVAVFAGKTSQSRLFDVSCLAATSCFSVGGWSNGTTVKTLVERRVGTHWQIVPSPNVAGSIESVLEAVSCVSATDCTAVGLSDTLSAHSEAVQPLIEHWNGSAWAIVPSPNPSNAPFAVNLLTSVSCATATNCTAVGFVETEQSQDPLIEHWNGTAWSIIPGPRPAFGELTELTSVSCSGPKKCTAVGYYETGTGDRQLAVRTFVERWDGTGWTLQPSPNVKGQAITALFDVSCPTATSCSAVGLSESDSETNTRPIVEHWNGRKWVLLPVALPHGAISTALASISCRGTSTCYGVGNYSTTTATKTLVERWNGHAWKVAPSPNPPNATGAGLNAVSCASRTTCTAVGSFDANNGFFTLIERGP